MAEINVTPLIDVVLVLLVVFMVITPLLSSGLPVELPMATTTVTAPDDGKHIVISITKENEWAVDQDFLEDKDTNALIMAVRAKFRAAKDPNEKKVLVKADRTLSYGDVREVMDALASAEMRHIGIAAGKEK